MRVTPEKDRPPILRYRTGLREKVPRTYHDSFTKNGITLYHADVLELYDDWPAPTVIVSDGPYGVRGFPGDVNSPEELPKWYEPHIAAWAKKATGQTTLWFWNTEIGWANIHPVLVKHGWEYKACYIWDKGINHVAGNCNTKSLRQLPIVTEVCVQYLKKVFINNEGNTLTIKDWLRKEWIRTGLPLNKTNAAAGLKNAATRKYFTKCRLWYFPPPDVFVRIVEYANKYGKPEGRPYFSLDGVHPVNENEWARLRAKFFCEAGQTNVWRENQVRGEERIKRNLKCVHNNQKPLKLTELVIRLSSEPGDLVWEPFGGLCTGALASVRLMRKCVAAEINREYYELAIKRIVENDR